MCQHCNERKLAAKTAGELSSELFFGLFVRVSCNERVSFVLSSFFSLSYDRNRILTLRARCEDKNARSVGLITTLMRITVNPSLYTLRRLYVYEISWFFPFNPELSNVCEY